MKTNRSKRNLPLLALALGLAVTLPTFAQEPGTNSSQTQRPPESQQPPANQDLLEILQLTGEQRAAIRAIRIANRDEQMAINRRLRLANRALDEALEAETPDEALIEQRVKEFSEAQAASVRLRVRRELRIRRVLTPAQQATLSDLQHKAHEAETPRQQRIQNQNSEDRRPRNRPNQGNSIAPGPDLRRNNLPRRP